MPWKRKKQKNRVPTEKENVNVENVMEQEQVEDPVIIESEDVKMETEPDYMQMEVKNPAHRKVLKLEEEAKRQNELEQLRSKRIQTAAGIYQSDDRLRGSKSEEYKRRTEAK